MKRVVPLLVLAVTLAGGMQLHGEARRRPAIRWQNDLEAARELAEASDRPLLIVLGAPWCGYCRKLEASTLRDPAIVRYVNTSFVPVKVDVDRHRRVAEVLEVDSVPCTVVLSPKADLLGRFVGFADATHYAQTLREARQLHLRMRQASRSGP